MIKVYNRNMEDFSMMECNFPIYRGTVLGNPYTHLQLEKTKAIFKVKNREEAIEKYSEYFDLQYKYNNEFKAMIDLIYDCYVSGKDVYLECYCKPEPCHGDVIVKKLNQMVIKNKIKEIRYGKTNEKKMERVL